MEDKSWLFTAALADHLHLSMGRYFPKNFEKITLQEPMSVIRSGMIDPLFAFEDVHYSWVIKALKERTLYEQRVFCAVVPARIAGAVARKFGLIPADKIASPLAHKLLFETLYFSLFPHAKIPPLQWVEEPVSRLVYLSKIALERLCDFLGLYDLAGEMQKAIDRTTIERIYATLSSKEVAFLERALGEKNPWSLPKIGLSTWTKSSPGLRHILQKRGLMRLCIALSGQHPLLIEHLKYKLDVGRAHILEQLVRPESIAGATHLVHKQLEAIFESLNTQESKANS